MRRPLRLVALPAGALAFSALAQVGDPEFRVNTYTTDKQRQPYVASNADGSSIVVVWKSFGQDGSGEGVFAQRFNRSGALGAEFHVNTYTTGYQNQARVAVQSGGDFVVVWRDKSGEDGSGYGVFGQRYDASGAPQAGEFRVNTDTTGNQGYAHVVADSPSTFLVVWGSQADLSTPAQILGRRFDSGGGALGAEFVVTTGPSAAVYLLPDLAANPSGDFVVAWGVYPSGGVYARRFASGAAPLGGEFRVDQYTTGSGYAPRVAIADSGGFFVAWSNKGEDGSGYGVFARRYDASGASLGGEFRVNAYTTGNQYVRSATYVSGSFVVAWQHSTGGAYDVIAQRFRISGSPTGAPFKLNTMPHNSVFPSLAPIGTDGLLAAVWQGPDENLSGIYARGVLLLASGDADGDSSLTVSDVFYLINYLFAGGPPPIGPGDVTGDGAIDVTDVFYLINFLFAGGPAPV